VKRRDFTAEDIAEMRRMRFDRRRSSTLIGRKFGCDHSTVLWWTDEGYRQRKLAQRRAKQERERLQVPT